MQKEQHANANKYSPLPHWSASSSTIIKYMTSEQQGTFKYIT